MSETTLTVTQIVSSGVQQNPAAANADGSKFVDDGTERTFLRVKNAGGSPITVTTLAQRTSVQAPGLGAVAVANLTDSVAATTGDELIGPFPPAYIDSSGFVHCTFSSVTSVTVEVFKLARTVN